MTMTNHDNYHGLDHDSDDHDHIITTALATVYVYYCNNAYDSDQMQDHDA